jgi:hypothetical protein
MKKASLLFVQSLSCWFFSSSTPRGGILPTKVTEIYGVLLVKADWHQTPPIISIIWPKPKSSEGPELIHSGRPTWTLEHNGGEGGQH